VWRKKENSSLRRFILKMSREVLEAVRLVEVGAAWKPRNAHSRDFGY